MTYKCKAYSTTTRNTPSSTNKDYHFLYQTMVEHSNNSNQGYLYSIEYLTYFIDTEYFNTDLTRISKEEFKTLLTLFGHKAENI